MEVSLPPALKRFVEEKVKEGVYQSESDVICDALRRRLKESNADRFATLRRQLAHLEIVIKEIVIGIERQQSQEVEELDSIKETQEMAEAILSSLQKTMESYAEILRSTSSLF
jgi:putative addiction module CopG family antidote